MSKNLSELPAIMTDDPSIIFLKARRLFRSLTGRELGFAHATRLLAKFIPNWRELPLEGPDGMAILVDLSQREGYFNGGFGNTTEHMGALFPFIPNDGVVMDVGANIGVWSRAILAQRRLSKLVAFEPVGRNFQLLEKNLAMYPCASCQPYAVGSKSGFAAFSTHLDGGQNFVLPAGNASSRSRTVPMISLDDYHSEHKLTRLDVLKVDCEGFEAEVFRGAARLLEEFSPVIYFEFIPKNKGEEIQKAESFAILRGHEYVIHAVSSAGELIDLSDPDRFSCDFIAVKKHSKISG